MIPLVSISLGLCVAAGYVFSKPPEERANLRARNSCGDLEAVIEMEGLPSATKREQVEELERTILFLRDKCDENAGRAIERLEKVRARWDASLKMRNGGPVSELRWKPKGGNPQPAHSQNMLPKRIMRG